MAELVVEAAEGLVVVEELVMVEVEEATTGPVEVVVEVEEEVMDLVEDLDILILAMVEVEEELQTKMGVTVSALFNTILDHNLIKNKPWVK